VLQLVHNMPDLPIKVVALVQLDLALEEMQREDLEVGAWLNVTGYVSENKPLDGEESVTTVRVDAVRIWNAGSIRVTAYEDALRAKIQTQDTVRPKSST
jgi:hypothetical protein